MKRYLLFQVGANSQGGFQDLVATSDDLSKLLNLIENNEYKEYHVFDIKTRKIVAQDTVSTASETLKLVEIFSND